eukprot:5305657-Amphidinium_carterae.1
MGHPNQYQHSPHIQGQGKKGKSAVTCWTCSKRETLNYDRVAEILGAIMGIKDEVKDDSCCQIISQGDVGRSGQKRLSNEIRSFSPSLMQTSGFMGQETHYHV